MSRVGSKASKEENTKIETKGSQAEPLSQFTKFSLLNLPEVVPNKAKKYFNAKKKSRQKKPSMPSSADKDEGCVLLFSDQSKKKFEKKLILDTADI